MNPDKNLLEAFQDLSPSERRSTGEAQAPVERLRDREERATRGPSSSWGIWVRENRGLLEVVGALVCFAVGVFFHRAMSEGTQAAGPQQPAVVGEPLGSQPLAPGDSGPGPASQPQQGAVTPPPAPPGPQPALSAPISPLYDPANQYTIQCITYDRTSANDLKAQNAWQYLLEQGVDQAFPPVAHRGRIYLLVGAAPVASELVSLRDRVRGLPGPAAKYPFRDAFQIRKDSLDIR